MNSIKQLLKDTIIDGDEIEIYDLPDIVVNWPEVEEDEDEEYSSSESLDLENWEILELHDDKMVMCAGGDWQEPLTFTLVSDGKGKLMATNIHGDFNDGMSHEDILNFFK